MRQEGDVSDAVQSVGIVLASRLTFMHADDEKGRTHLA